MPGRREIIERCRAEMEAFRRELEQVESGWRKTDPQTGADLTEGFIEDLQRRIALKEAEIAYIEKQVRPFLK